MKSKMDNDLMNKIKLEKYSGVIFDLDGTLVDSSIAVMEVLTTWCELRNISIDEVLKRCHGARIIDFIPDVAPHLELAEELKYLTELEAITTTGLVEISGAKQFIKLLEANKLKWSIATSGVGHIAKLRLTACDLKIPEVFITSELVKQGKPSPDPFVLAAKNLRLEPKQCLAFEDSDAGIKSALLAGCDVVVIGQLSTIVDKRIVARVDNYQPLIELIVQMETV